MNGSKAVKHDWEKEGIRNKWENSNSTSFKGLGVGDRGCGRVGVHCTVGHNQVVFRHRIIPHELGIE